MTFKCDYCPKEYKREGPFKEHVQQHKFAIQRSFAGEKSQLTKCWRCGNTVIVPPKNMNFGSIANLRQAGYTGDIDYGYLEDYFGWRPTCIPCMKKLGWGWGESVKEETE